MKTYRTFVADPIDREGRHPTGRLLMVEPLSNVVGLDDVVSSVGLAQARRTYLEEAGRVVDFFQQTMPQGLVDAIFTELARREASVIRLSEASIRERNNRYDVIP